MRKIGMVIVCSLIVFACGDDDDDGNGGGACPDEPSETVTWSYDGDDDLCEQLETALNMADDGEDSECESMTTAIEDHGNECHGTVSAVCSGFEIEATCEVESSGDADCDATIEGEIANKDISCDFELTFR